MEEVVQLEKRHGSKIHVEVANIFALLVLVLLCLYSLLDLLNVKFIKRPALTRMLRSPISLTLVWTILCIWGVMHHFNSDIKQIARRYGQLAISMATITVFLSMKPAILPRTYQVALVSLHKWIGRSSILCATVHGLIYIYSYARKAAQDAAAHKKEAGAHVKRHGGHEHHFFSLFNVFGMICLASFLVIFGSSLGVVRRRSYALFYALHRPLVILIYVLMIWHARPSSWLLVPVGIILLVLQVALRLAVSKRVHISEVKHYGPSLKLITFDPPVTETMLGGPGHHIRISKPLYYPTAFFQSSHPYSLVGTNKLIVRETRFKLIEGSSYSLYGPFSTSFVPDQYTHIVVFAGGSGVSLLPSFANVGTKQKFVWVTRSSQEIPVLSELGLGHCDVYITNTRTQQAADGDAAEDYELQEFEIDSGDDEVASGNIDDEQQLLERPASGTEKEGISRYSGRPNFSKVVEKFYNENVDSKARLCVVACGPEQLVRDVSAWAKGKQYDLWTEIFAL